MKKVSKKVVKETTGNRKVKTTTTIHESRCGCQSFECLHQYRDHKGLTENADKSLSLTEQKTLSNNGKEVNLKMSLLVTPVIVEGKDYNIIRVEETIIEETTFKKEESKGSAVLKGIFEEMMRDKNERVTEKLDLKSVLERLSNDNNRPTANEMNDIMKMIFSDKKLPDNVKVIAMDKFPTFEEFKEMIKKS